MLIPPHWPRRVAVSPAGDCEALLASVLAAARESLGLELSFRVERVVPEREDVVPVQSAGRVFGVLTSERPLIPSERQVVAALASILADRMSGDDWAEEQARSQVDRIRRVLAQRSMTVFLQPIFNLRTSKLVGAEALARFPETPGVSPDIWFAEAEAAGFGVALERMAVQAALEVLDWLPEDVFLSINTSPATAMDRCVREDMRDRPASRIVLEMTEHSRIDDYEHFDHRLASRRAAGVKLAVDDAGAGFSSMRHVLQMRPNLIKLDISLVRGIDTDPVRQALARSISRFAGSLGATVVAEGIETAEELRTIRRLRIPLGQGFYLGRPAPLDRWTSTQRAAS